jgi:hypothetical protein
MGFDHVGHHYQPDLPPIVQKTLPQRGSRALWITCGLEKRDEPGTLILMVAGRYPHDTSGAQVRGGMLPIRSTTPARGDRGFQGQGRAGQVPPKAGKPKSNLPTRFRCSLTLAPNSGRESGTGQTD